MNTTLARVLVFLLLVSGETLLRRWSSPVVLVPLTLALLTGAAFFLPQRFLLRLTLLGALAIATGSRLPVGTSLLFALVPPHVLGLVLRRPRPDLPWTVRGAASAVLLLLTLLAFQVAEAPLTVPLRLLGPTVGLRLVLPAFLGGALASAVAPLLARERARPLLSALGALPP